MSDLAVAPCHLRSWPRSPSATKLGRSIRRGGVSLETVDGKGGPCVVGEYPPSLPQCSYYAPVTQPAATALQSHADPHPRADTDDWGRPH